MAPWYFFRKQLIGPDYILPTKDEFNALVCNKELRYGKGSLKDEMEFIPEETFSLYQIVEKEETDLIVFFAYNLIPITLKPGIMIRMKNGIRKLFHQKELPLPAIDIVLIFKSKVYLANEVDVKFISS